MIGLAQRARLGSWWARAASDVCKRQALEPGDCLGLYGDGITEAMNAREEEYGQARFTAELVHALDRSAAEIAAHIVDRVAAWRGAAPQSDDITLAVLKRRP